MVAARILDLAIMAIMDLFTVILSATAEPQEIIGTITGPKTAEITTALIFVKITLAIQCSLDLIFRQILSLARYPSAWFTHRCNQ